MTLSQRQYHTCQPLSAAVGSAVHLLHLLASGVAAALEERCCTVPLASQPAHVTKPRVRVKRPLTCADLTWLEIRGL